MKRLTVFLLTLLTIKLIGQDFNPEILTERLRMHVEILASDSMEGRGLGTSGALKARKYIHAQFKEAGLLPYDEDYLQEINFRTGQAWVSGGNIIGWLKGTDPAMQNEFIVLGAHYDHVGYKMEDGEKVIYYGADDNASGTATTIELARYFAANPQLVRRSLIFCAFDAEESGLIGSDLFVKENTLVADSTIKLMFSLDTIGMLEDNNGLIMKGISSIAGGEKAALSLAEKHGIRLKDTSVDIEGATDTWPFGQKKIPATHVFTGIKSPYHKPEDTWEKLDYAGMASIAQFMQLLVAELSGMPELVPAQAFTNQQKPAGLKFNLGIAAGVGTSKHNYSSEFYKANSIFAAKAGLFAQLHIGKRFTVQPEILFQTDGSKSAEGNFRRQSVAIPVNIHFNLLNQWGGLVKGYVLAGGYYQHSFSGKNGSLDLDFDNLTNADEWGWSFGFGTDIKAWQVKSTWYYGLRDLSKICAEEIYPMGWFLSVGYKL